MLTQTLFLAWWRYTCPKLWLGEAIKVYAGESFVLSQESYKG